MRITVASDKYILLACDKVYRLRLYWSDKWTRCAFAGVFATCGPLDCLLSLTELASWSVDYPTRCSVL